MWYGGEYANAEPPIDAKISLRLRSVPSSAKRVWHVRSTGQSIATSNHLQLDRRMYGDSGLKLVQHAKRTLGLPHLPPYQTELVRNMTREVRELDRDVNALLAPFAGSFNPAEEPPTACALLVNHLSMRRNKRCLLAYHRVRAERLEQMCWNGEDVLDRQTSAQGLQEQVNADGTGDGSSSLSPEEDEYVRQYADLLAAYKGQWTDIDLTGSVEPPRDLFIDVRVLKDAGEIQTEYG